MHGIKNVTTFFPTKASVLTDRVFGGDDMGLLDLMPANISPGAISFAIKCMMEGGGVCFGPDAETLA